MRPRVGASDRAGIGSRASSREIWRALVLGTRDYAGKCGFSSAVLGLSGGIDSALTAAIAAEALGAGCVLGVLMPSPYSSQGSLDDAHELARNLGIVTITLPIEPLMRTFDETLRAAFGGDPQGRGPGEHPGADPRQSADGALEHAGRAAADHGQQV